MENELFIDKKKLSETESDYVRFYRRGIELLQKHCGAVWTDYNIHDPGVTILEQLCYALSELIYKSSFGVEDYFVDESSNNPLKKTGLSEPHECIPNGCVTVNDFRKVIFDEVDEVGNVWLEINTKNISGLYTVYVCIADQYQITEDLKKQINEKIRRVFVSRRNLSEDISEIIILEREYLDLCGHIEIHTRRPVEEVYGEIYYQCSKYVSSSMFYHSVKDLQLRGMTLTELYNGPLLKNGIILDDDLTERERIISIQEMISCIKRVRGVIEVDSLYLQNGEQVITGETLYCQNNRVKAIRIPFTEKNISLKIESSRKFFMPDMESVYAEAQKRFSCNTCFPGYIDEIKKLFPAPSGTYRKFNNYYSFQNHFPTIYGISYEGLSKNESPSRKGKAKQLKAYLYFFDQVMADFLETVQNIKEIFSPETSLKATYFSKYLDNSSVPGIEEIYSEKPEKPDKVDKEYVISQLNMMIRSVDDYYNRRSEILDFLLAIYGLEFKQVSLRHFLQPEKNVSVREKILMNKVRYLKYASLYLLRNGKGFDYTEKGKNWQKKSGLEIGTLLRTGNDPQSKELIIIEHLLLRPDNYREKLPDAAFFEFRVSAVFPGFSGNYKNENYRKFVMEIIEKQVPPHIYVNYIWCTEVQWRRLLPVYIAWICGLNYGSGPTEISIKLTNLIIEFTKDTK